METLFDRGGDCEDTCCRNWKVKLDRHHYDVLKKVVKRITTEVSGVIKVVYDVTPKPPSTIEYI